MSPRTALESPVFAFYFAMAVGLLVVGGLVLALLQWGLRKNVGHAWSAYLGWLLMVPILLLCFFLGRAVGIVFLTLIAMPPKEFSADICGHVVDFDSHDKIADVAVGVC